MNNEFPEFIEKEEKKSFEDSFKETLNKMNEYFDRANQIIDFASQPQNPIIIEPVSKPVASQIPTKQVMTKTKFIYLRANNLDELEKLVNSHLEKSECYVNPAGELVLLSDGQFVQPIIEVSSCLVDIEPFE